MDADETLDHGEDGATRELARPSGSSRRATIGKLAAGAGAAWIAPQIISAPAAAAATCAAGTTSWNGLTTGSVFSTATINGVTVTLTTTPLTGTTILATNRTIRVSPNGSVLLKAVQFQQLPDATGIGQDVTFSFDASVSNVEFTLYDIDNLTGGWGDRIEVLTPGFVSSIPAGGEVIGTGTAADPFRSALGNTNFGDLDDRGNLTLTYAGPITGFSFRYTNAVNTGGGNQRIGISDIVWSC